MWVGPPDRRGGFSFDFIMLVFAGFETDGLSLWRQKTSDQNRNRTDDNKAFKCKEDIRVKTTTIPMRDATGICCGFSILVECVLILMYCTMKGPCL